MKAFFSKLYLFCYNNSFDFLPISGGKLLLEMNRILRPGGYFIMSTKHDSREEEEGWSHLNQKFTHT